MDRLVQRNVLAMSGRAVEAAGDVNTLLLDKTGTITIGNRQATEFLPVDGRRRRPSWPTPPSCPAWPTTPPRAGPSSVLAKEQYGLRERHEGELQGAEFVEFTAQTRMSGIDLADGRSGAQGRVRRRSGSGSATTAASRRRAWARWSTHLRCRRHAAGGRRADPAQAQRAALGVIYLKDIVKEGIAERFAEMRKMGIRTVMITGDNPLTAKAIADEAGVDDFLAEATPEDKMALIRKEQEGGKLVAMTGDGTNDAPALAQADVGVAMNTGTSAAKEAGNMVDLDSNPTKLIEIVEIGKQLLITRGALTTFSIANDVAKYFAIIPAMFQSVIPGLTDAQHHGPAQPGSRRSFRDHLQRADHHRADPAGPARRAVTGRRRRRRMLRRNLLIYGVGGLIIPFIGIKLIDLIIQFIPGFR